MSEKNCKVILLGESSVGKSSILQRFTKDEFKDVLVSTVSEYYTEKKLDINGIEVNLEIWDTAGQERYRTLVRNYYKGSKAAILVYDISQKITFDELKNYWYKEIKENCPDISMLFNIYFNYLFSFGCCGE